MHVHANQPAAARGAVRQTQPGRSTGVHDRPAGQRGAALRAPGDPAASALDRLALDRLLASASSRTAATLHDGDPALAGATAEAAPAAPVVAVALDDEAMVDAPAASYIVPFDRHPLAAAGERIIFRAEFTDPSPASYRLDYSSTGGHFTSAAGPTSRSIAGLTSGNVDFFVPTGWLGLNPVQVVLKVVKIADGSVAQTETWDFGLKNRVPTTMTQKETTGERSLPGVYSYDLGPAVVPLRPPFYEHQTILERFGNWTLANIAPADIAEPYRSAHGLTTAAAVSSHFLGNYAGSNGTFTVNAKDQIYDQHGGHPNLANLVANLSAPKAIEVALPQVYEATPGVTLGSYTVTRILQADGTTWKVKKG